MRRIPGLGRGQLAGKNLFIPGRFLSLAGIITGPPGCFPGHGRLHHLADQPDTLLAVFLQPVSQLVRHHGINCRFGLRGAKLAFGLALKLQDLFRDRHGKNRCEPFPHIPAFKILVLLLQQAMRSGVVVDSLGKGRLVSDLVRTAVDGAHQVDKTVRVLLVVIGILEGTFDPDAL